MAPGTPGSCLVADCWLLVAGCWLLARSFDVPVHWMRLIADKPKDLGRNPAAWPTSQPLATLPRELGPLDYSVPVGCFVPRLDVKMLVFTRSIDALL